MIRVFVAVFACLIALFLCQCSENPVSDSAVNSDVEQNDHPQLSVLECPYDIAFADNPNLLSALVDASDIAADDPCLREAKSGFGLRLFRQIAQDQDDGNIFISPLSVALALGMALSGAEGETRQAMQETLELVGFSPEEAIASFRRLIDQLQGKDPVVTLDFANSIW